jgi:hypothetical protein
MSKIMRRNLLFLEPVAYTSDGIVIENPRGEVWNRPSKYAIVYASTGIMDDLSDEHCQQIDDYLSNKERMNPLDE